MVRSAFNLDGWAADFGIHYLNYDGIFTMYCERLCLELHVVSEYDQEIPQSKTVDKPVVSQKTATQQSRDTRKTNKAKKSALSSPSRRPQSQNGRHKAMHNKTQNNHRISQWQQQSTTNRQQQKHRLRADSSQSHWTA